MRIASNPLVISIFRLMDAHLLAPGSKIFLGIVLGAILPVVLTTPYASVADTLFAIAASLDGRDQGGSDPGTTLPDKPVTREQQIEPVAKERELVVCIRPNTPFFYRNERGTRAGLEHDLLAAFAAEQDVEIKFFNPGSFKAIFAALAERQCDIAGATITRTEKRESSMDFSPSYFPVRIVAVEKRGAVTTRPRQLRRKIGATIVGSTYLEAIEKIGEVEKLWVDDSREMFRAVNEGRADFLACDSAIVLELIKKYPDLAVTVALSERDELAFALQKDSTLTAPLTRFMEEFHKSGGLRDLLIRYFDEQGADMILSEK